MPLYKRRPFEANPVPPGLRDDEEVYYLKLTNEIFRNYDEYYARVILCNSMVWSCNLTGKANLTYQEALDSEKGARKLLKGFPKALKKAILYCSTLTSRSKLPDVVDDVLSYARDRYFKGEDVLAVIGNLWCPSRVVNIIEPTAEEIETYRKEQIEKGEAENNDYLKDDTWGPSPDLFRYEIEELDPDNPDVKTALMLDSIDVKREKAALTRDKCKFLLKLAMDYDEEKRKFVVKPGILSAHGINKIKYVDIFAEKSPIFEESLGPMKSAQNKSLNSSSSKGPEKSKNKTSGVETPKTSPKSKNNKVDSSKKPSPASSGKKSAGSNDSVKKIKKEKMERKLTPEELKQLEIERKAKEKEKVKAQRKMMADFKKLWFKPKEDLEVEDLKDLPSPDPVSFKIPNNLFGEFMMVMEFMSSYSTFLKVRESFPSGLTLDALERALTRSEISGPFSDILQLLLRALFRLQEGERMEYAKEDGGGKAGFEMNGFTGSVGEAIHQATSAAAWSQMYQNSPLHKLGVDHSSVTEILRLHLLSSGARHSAQSRGSCAENDDPGLYLRMDEPQILKKLTSGTVFDLTLSEKLRVIECLIHQILSYTAVKDIMEESYDLFRQERVKYRALAAAEKRKEAEDHLWRQRLKADRVIPDIKALAIHAEIAVANANESGEEDAVATSSKPKKTKVVQPPSLPATNNKVLLTDEQIEAALIKKDKEIARRKQDFLWQEAELLDQINKHEKKLGAHPLGRDRAFRRYWVFPTVPGLFVEHDDENLGPCLSIPTPFIGEVNLNDMNFISENFDKLKQVDREGSDKENSSSTSPKKASKKKSAPNTPSIKKEPVSRPMVFGICTGDTESCPVHSQNLQRTRWSFFWEAEHIDALIAGLTPRGKREKELRQNLEEAKDTLKGLIKKCPVVKLNKDKTYPENVSAAPDRRPQRGGTSSKNQNDPNLGFPCGTSVTKIMELHLRDLILEFEEKIFLGGLGSLKVPERNDWRTAIEGSSYHGGVDQLNWGGSTKSMKITDDDPNEEANSSGNDQDNSEKIVKKLSCAILQIQQAVEHKFMKRPLVEREEEKKKKKTAESEATWKSVWNSSNTPVDRWQISLMKSTSFSQLFVHFYTLESSVEWSRSVLNARCRVCRRKGDPEKMLLCDTCNKGHHIYCLKPPMDGLPKGDWFCVDCRPDEPLPTPSKKRPLTDDDIIDELDDEDDDGVERGGKKRNRDDDDDDEDDDDGVPEVCNVCGHGGEVICCDSCPLVFHLLCLNPPKTRVPRGTWFCPECMNPKKKSRSKNSRDSKASKRKRPVKRKLKYQETESDESESEEEEEEDDEDLDRASDSDEQVVKVKFGRSKKKSPDGPAAPKARRIMDSTSEEEEEEEEGSSTDQDEDLGRTGKRRSASAAAAKIFQSTKRMRSDSKENETSESSNDSNYNNPRKRSFGDDDEELADCSKRTRLQRMNTNNKVENGELDNVLLDKLISDVIKQKDAWPFLKPVTRTEAPDYHEIVKYPMDLGTIKYKLNSMVYTCNEEFVSDLLLVFTNCFLYNDSSNHVHEVGMRLKQYCEKRCSKLGINFSSGPDPEDLPIIH